MNSWSFYDRPAAQIPFQLNGFDGIVAVYYGMNDDPRKAGFDMIPGLNFNLDVCRGYPLMHARIEEYAASGYRTACAWIQVVSNERSRRTIEGTMAVEKSVWLDVAPAFSETGLPFAAYGNYPQLFDAPCHNLGPDAELKWTADTFLTTLPLRSKTEEIRWLLGFRWGYIEYANPDEKPVVLLPLEVPGPAYWNDHLNFLRSHSTGWVFHSEIL